jgi:hypothetical protein
VGHASAFLALGGPFVVGACKRFMGPVRGQLFEFRTLYKAVFSWPDLAPPKIL